VTSFVSYDGTVLHYDAVGVGLPLVCLPGGPGRAVAYLEDLAGLSAERTLVLLDPRATGHSELPSDPAAWRAGAELHEGSWWEEWTRWVGERSGGQRDPPALGSERYPALGEAPGTYVLT